MYINWFTQIISINGHVCYTENGGNKNSPDSLNLMVKYYYHSENREITW